MRGPDRKRDSTGHRDPAGGRLVIFKGGTEVPPRPESGDAVTLGADSRRCEDKARLSPKVGRTLGVGRGQARKCPEQPASPGSCGEGAGLRRDRAPTARRLCPRPPPVLGSDPYIHVKGYDAGWIQLVCRSAGWFPQPLAEWRDPQGRVLRPLSDGHVLEAGLFRIAVSSRVRDSTLGNVSCTVRNLALGQEKTTAMLIAGKSRGSKRA